MLRSTSIQTNKLQAPGAKDNHLNIKQTETKAGERFFGKLRHWKAPCVQGNLESHVNVQGKMFLLRKETLIFHLRLIPGLYVSLTKY